MQRCQTASRFILRLIRHVFVCICKIVMYFLEVAWMTIICLRFWHTYF